MNTGTIIYIIVNSWVLALVVGMFLIHLGFEFCDANFLMVSYIIFVCVFMVIYAYIDMEYKKIGT